MITYEYPEGKLGVVVKLDGQKVGEILRVEGGYAYFPRGQKRSGAVLPSVQAVKRSLEE